MSLPPHPCPFRSARKHRPSGYSADRSSAVDTTIDARLEFRIKLIACDGDDGWVEGTLAAIHETLRSPQPPAVNEDCEYCRFAARWAGA